MATSKSTPAVKSTPIDRKAAPKAAPAAKKAAPAKKAAKAPVYKPGSFYNYRTPTGKTGRMKVTSVRGGKGQPGGTWVTGIDKDSKAEISLRPGCLSA